MRHVPCTIMAAATSLPRCASEFCDADHPSPRVWQLLNRMVIAGILLVGNGCVYVPTPYLPDPNYEGSGKLPDVRYVEGCFGSLHVGTSRRAEVEQVLGKPTGRSADDRVYVYAQQMFSGYFIIFPPLYPVWGPLEQRTYYLCLEFDDSGLLQSRKLKMGEGSEAGMGYMIYHPADVPKSVLMSATAQS